MNLVLTDNEEIKKVNTEFRSIQAPTDVLSFPMIPFRAPADYALVEDEDTYFDLDTGELFAGRYYDFRRKVIAQAKEYGHSVTREFCFGCTQYAASSGIRSYDTQGSGSYGAEAGKCSG